MESNIGEVAKILGVAPSKLRYWDTKGLIRLERNQENNYRTFSFQTIMDICDVIFYRDLSISIED
ncbi:MAG: MerR family transcriptional regulator, partial [Clostridiales bacterium]|nr:MerR family transcriptional regulator [Clostridiales bacterium]